MKMKTAIKHKIDAINLLLPIVNELGNFPITYNDGSYPSYVILDKPIEVKNQFVYVFYDTYYNNYIQGKTRYNLNKTGEFDEYGEIYLLADLKLILKAFKKSIKENKYEI